VGFASGRGLAIFLNAAPEAGFEKLILQQSCRIVVDFHGFQETYQGPI